jgi:outer membrane protein OmpA-like peptidoglycan-associated protein
MRRCTIIITSALMVAACAHGAAPAAPAARPAAEGADTGAAVAEGTTATDPAPHDAPAPSDAPPDTRGGSGGTANGDAGGALSFQASDAASSGSGHAKHTLLPDDDHAAVLFRVVDKDKGPMRGVVVALTGPDGKKSYTGETTTDGVAEVLLPVGASYDAVYLSLGRRDIAAKVDVPNEPNLRLRLTLRYKRFGGDAEPKLVLSGVTFDTGKASLRPESFPRLETVIEYMSHKPSARVEISGHTDNQGNPAKNKALSRERAEAVRAYLVEQGIESARLVAVGYGAERPIASNDSESGRADNRRIEARELP